MALADTLIETARGLLTAFGQNVTFTRTSGTTYDPALGTTSSTTSTYTGYVYVSKFSNKEIGQPIGSTVIKKNDLSLIATSMDQVPQEGDTVSISSVDYRVLEVMETNLSGTNVLYKVAVRI